MKLSGSPARTTSRTLETAAASDDRAAWRASMKEAAGPSLRFAQGMPTEEPLDLASISLGATGARRISRIAVNNLGDAEARRIGQKAREIDGICQSFVEAMNGRKNMPAGQVLRAWNACRSGLIRFYESVLAEKD